MPAAPIAVALALVLPLAGPSPSPETHGGPHLFAECKAFAPDQQSCGISIVPQGGVELMIPIDIVFSGTLVLKGEQSGTVVWNGSCVIPLGFFDTGVGFCTGEAGQKYKVNQVLNLSVHVGVYGYGWYGLRAYYY